MGFWYVTIEKIIGKTLICCFFDDYGSYTIKSVWSKRLLKKKIKKDGTLKLVDGKYKKTVWTFNNIQFKHLDFNGFEENENDSTNLR